VKKKLEMHKSVKDKCTFVSAYAQECSARSLQQREFFAFVPALLGEIFGLENNKSNWFIAASHRADFDALSQLLSPNSIFFELLLKSVEESLRVTVPVSLLPVSIQKIARSSNASTVHSFFKSKLAAHPQSAPTIQLDLFEYYTLSFVLLATRGIQGRSKAASSRIGEGVTNYLLRLSTEPDQTTTGHEQQIYQDLFEQYLQWFFPKTATTMQSSPRILSPRGHVTPVLSQSPQHMQQNRERRLAKPFLQIVTEIWLSQNGPLEQAKQPYCMPTPMVLSSTTTLVRHLLSVADTSIRPTINLSEPTSSYSPYASRHRSPIMDREKDMADAPMIMTESLQLLQKPLWNFLFSAIVNWPAGSVTPFALVVITNT